MAVLVTDNSRLGSFPSFRCLSGTGRSRTRCTTTRATSSGARAVSSGPLFCCPRACSSPSSWRSPFTSPPPRCASDSIEQIHAAHSVIYATVLEVAGFKLGD